MTDLLPIVDAAMVILIWAVQLIIYPGLAYYSKDDLHAWHSTYTSRISILVIPIMLLQLGLHLYLSITDFSTQYLISLLFVLVCWFITFTVSAPLHGKISQGIDTKKDIARLVKTNWSRTILWTLTFFININFF